MMFKRFLLVFGFVSTVALSCGALTLKQIGTIAHQESAYTQGLFYYKGYLYESIGLYGQSEFRKLDPNTGKVLKKVGFNKRYFAEGACELGGWIFVLTWNEMTCFVVNPSTLEIVAQIPYQGEGWGLCSDGKLLIMSNGSEQLAFRDPKDLKVLKRVTVRYKGKPVDQLNELEYINGEIWANVYMTDEIVRIDPKTGIVKEMMQFSDKIPAYKRGQNAEVMNGIAWDSAKGQVLLGGKLWKTFFKYTVTP